MSSQVASGLPDLQAPRVARLAAEAVRTAHAVGLIEDAPDFPELTSSNLTSVLERVRRAGVAERAVTELERVDSTAAETVGDLLEQVQRLLEESPLPEFEWNRLLEILERDRLAELLGISPSSSSRYARGERRTPDDVAARLHFLALVVGDLAGAYNEIGIRRWFGRSRSALDGHAPAELLEGDWDPDDPGPRRVRELARSLVTLPGA